MSKVLITGANSFVGSNYLFYSKNKNIQEVCLIEKKPDQINFENIDVILHVAAIVHQERGIPESEYYRVNRDLCLEVAERAKACGVKQFVFLSTIKVYGKFLPGSLPWNESSVCSPEDSYGNSKYEAECELKKLASRDFIVSIVRTPLVYGPGVRANMRSIIKLVRSFPVLPLAGINNKRNFTYVENLVALIDRIIERKADGVYIAMDEGSLSTSELVKYISLASDSKIILFKLPGCLVYLGKIIMPRIFDRLFGTFDLDNTQTKKQLEYVAPIPSIIGIERTIQQMTN